MSEEKSLGQIAFEAYEERFSVHLRQRWADNPQHDAWNEAGETIAAEVRRRDEESNKHFDEFAKMNPKSIPKPDWALSPYESVAAMAMQGLLANPTESFVEASPRQIAEWSIEQADAFFVEASKRRNKC